MDTCCVDYRPLLQRNAYVRVLGRRSVESVVTTSNGIQCDIHHYVMAKDGMPNLAKSYVTLILDGAQSCFKHIDFHDGTKHHVTCSYPLNAGELEILELLNHARASTLARCIRCITIGASRET